MDFRVLYILIFLASSFFSNAQEAKFTSDELAFVEVYMEQKKLTYSSELLMDSLMKSHDMSPTEVKELFQKKLDNSRTAASSKEALFQNAIQQLNEHIQIRKEQEIERLCFVNATNLSSYKRILHQYKTDIVYQRSLKPLFDKYIAGQ